ncbi:cellulosome protein, partial [Sphingomonas sp. NPDC019816]
MSLPLRLTLAALLGSTAMAASAQERLSVDLSSDTGAFHGGASGTLYGLYDARLPHPNLVEGMALRTVSTKAQDGPQHPGADALEVATLLTDASGGDTYIYMTDIYREFPYNWKTGDCAQSVTSYIEQLRKQVRQVKGMDKRYRDRIVFVPFNEPEGNMFG